MGTSCFRAILTISGTVMVPRSAASPKMAIMAVDSSTAASSSPGVSTSTICTPYHADGVVIDVPVGGLRDDPVFHPGRIGQTFHLVRFQPGHAGGRDLAQRRGAAAGDHARFALHEIRDPGANFIHQFVQMHVRLRGFMNCTPDFRQHQGAGDDGVGPHAIDQWTDAYGFVRGVTRSDDVDM